MPKPVHVSLLQRRVLVGLGLGLCLSQIAQRVARSRTTIQLARRHLRVYFHAKNDIQLLRAGIRAGVLPKDILSRTT